MASATDPRGGFEFARRQLHVALLLTLPRDFLHGSPLRVITAGVTGKDLSPPRGRQQETPAETSLCDCIFFLHFAAAKLTLEGGAKPPALTVAPSAVQGSGGSLAGGSG